MILNKFQHLKKLTAFDLKIIAVVTMLLDHFAKILAPELKPYFFIGRISFILFAFLIVEGYLHSRNTNKYLLRLIIWAFLSEIPYDLAFSQKIIDFHHQNIFFTLATGLIAIKVIDSKISSDLKFLFVVLLATISNIFYFDYQYLGVLQIVFFYIFQSNFIKKIVSTGVLNTFFWGRISSQAAAILAFIPIWLYNGENGRKIGKWFYAFYAVHLLLFWLIKVFLLS